MRRRGRDLAVLAAMCGVLAFGASALGTSEMQANTGGSRASAFWRTLGPVSLLAGGCFALVVVLWVRFAFRYTITPG